MSLALRTIVDQVLAAFEAKDVEGVLERLADDAVLIDPHYPTPRMAGKGAIREGLGWVFATMDTLHFSVITFCSAEGGEHAALEVATRHTLRGGRAVELRQVLIVERHAGLITRLQAYPPYGPGGIGGLFLRLIRLRRRLTRSRAA